MADLNRREFLNDATRTSAATAAATALYLGAHPAQAKEAGEKVTLGFLGVGGRGSSLLRGFLQRDDVDVAWLCDPDSHRNAQLSDAVQEATGKAPQRVQDYRRVLDDPAVDAVVIATPDHWHSPLTVFACQAGKDVYVEKPLSHNIWEGRKAVEAARKHNRIVQVGTQNRSLDYNYRAIDYLNSGKLGRIPLVKVCNLKPGLPFRMPPDKPTPSGVDYNLWLGPAHARAFNEGHFHENWHYHWEYSGGDMANDGVHQLDLARWVIGKDFAKSVYCHGGNFAFEQDDNETPDTQTAVYDFGDMQLVYEQIGYGDTIRKTDNGVRMGDMFPYWLQNSTRIELYGTEGLMVLGRHGGGWQVFTKTHQRQPQVVEQQYGRFDNSQHFANFIDCIRTRQTPNADVEEGHRSAILVHLANISYRLGGRKLEFDPQTETFTGDEEANRLLRRDQRPEFAISETV